MDDTLTMAKVVAADRLAIAEGRLAAVRKDCRVGDTSKGCVYVFGDPKDRVGCAIGVALSDELRMKIHTGALSNGSLNLGLFDAFSVGTNLTERTLMIATQLLHDWWVGDHTILRPTSFVSEPPKWVEEFFEKVKNMPATQKTFEAWLDTVEANYLKAA